MTEADFVLTLMTHFPTEIRSMWSIQLIYTIAAAADFLRRQDGLRENNSSPNKLPALSIKQRVIDDTTARRAAGNAGNGEVSRRRT